MSDYNRIDFDFNLDEDGKYRATFSLYRRLIDGSEQVAILGSDQDFTGIIINLSAHHHGYSTTTTSGLLPKGRYNFFFIPKGSTIWTLERGINAIVFIQCDPLFLPQFGREVPILNEFLQSISQRRATLLTKNHLAVPSEVLDILGLVQSDASFNEKLTRDTFLRLKLRNIFVIGLTNSQERSRTVIPDRHIRRLQEIHQYIEDNLQFIKSTNALGSKEEKRKFKQFFGMSISDTLLYERAKKAEDLLVKTPLALQEIGHRVGYKDQSAFSRAFFKRHGMSPSDFRLKASSGQNRK